jgi:GDP-mannose 6-dehydrogenase
LTETLIGRGYQVRIFDDQVQLSQLIGANKAFLEKEIPHITSIMSQTIEEVITESDVVVVTHAGKAFSDAAELMRKDQVLIDLVGKLKNNPNIKATYEGIAW